MKVSIENEQNQLQKEHNSEKIVQLFTQINFDFM